MSLNFSYQNLQGRCFKGKNLTGADFSYADIRGCDFTNAILKNANLNQAKAGLLNQWIVLLIAILFVLSGISGVTSGLASVILSILFQPKYIEKYTILPGVISCIAIFIFFAITIRRGFGLDLAIATGGFTGILAGLILPVLWIRLGYHGLEVANEIGWRLAGAAAWLLAGFILGIFSLTAAWTIYQKSGVFLWIAWIIGLALSSYASWILKNSSTIWLQFWALTVAWAGFFALMRYYVSWQSLIGNPKFVLIEKMAIAFVTIGGTSFRRADLTDAIFTKSRLKSTDFRSANLTRTNFHTAKNLEKARVGNTILINPKVQNLLVTKKGANQSYVGCNLKGANLASADLSYADLTEADVSEATFFNATLEGANLTKIQALKTNFQQTRLTGACLSAWNIDSTTQLAGTICDYVYLLNNKRERRPSSGEFAPGEFTKLFQEVLNTVDVILRNGLDLQALANSLRQLKIQNEGTELSIRSIENIGDGIVLVKVNVPADANKQKIHAEFTQNYQIALQALEQRYQAELTSKDKQIEEWKEFAQLLASRPTKVQVNSTTKLVVIKLGKGDFNTGFPVTLQIGEEGNFPSGECTGELPLNLQIPQYYRQWQSTYRRSINATLRLDVPTTQVTNVSRSEFFEECYEAAENLRTHLNRWLNSEEFRPVKERMLEKLHPSESIRIILQTENSQLRRLPWVLWNLCDRYPKAEIALSSPTYDRILQFKSPKAKIKILAILGNSTGINLSQDQSLLEKLPDAEVTFLVEPQRQELNDQLWAQPWDILFFAGHSLTQTDTEIGQIHINQRDTLTIAELKNALRKAIAEGLQLAIFNSCDGLGLAVNLADLHIPQMIVMREPIPDTVAQEFLKSFLTAFANRKSLYQSVREAREKLQGLEDRFPCATWLPVIFQNPAEVPPTWEGLKGGEN